MKIFMTGVTGFIGGAVAARLVADGHDVGGLIRDPAKVAKVEGAGIRPVIGGLQDLELLAAEARGAEAVVHTADSDDRQAADAFIAALSGSGKTLIQTSGISIFCDVAKGEQSEEIVDDESAFTPVFRVERWDLDRAVLHAREMRGIVVSPALVYGQPLSVPINSQLQILYADARDSGNSHYVGRGLNRWSVVHIDDLVDLYALALDKAVPGTLLFAENGEAAYRDIAQAMADNLGLGEAVSLTPDAAIDRWGEVMAIYGFGSNSRVRGLQARTLGWTPAHVSITDWIRAEARS